MKYSKHAKIEIKLFIDESDCGTLFRARIMHYADDEPVMHMQTPFVFKSFLEAQAEGNKVINEESATLRNKYGAELYRDDGVTYQ